MTSPASPTDSKKKRKKLKKKAGSPSAKSTPPKSAEPLFHVVLVHKTSGQLSHHQCPTSEQAAAIIKEKIGRPYSVLVFHGHSVAITKGPNRHLLCSTGSVPLFDPPSMEAEESAAELDDDFEKADPFRKTSDKAEDLD